MKTTKIFILLFCILFLFAAPAAALTDKATNGDFSDGLDGWSTDYDTSYDGTASIVLLPNGADLDGDPCVRFNVDSGAGGGTAAASLYQVIGSGTITTISYKYRYIADTTSTEPDYYDRYPPTLTIYWGGTAIDTITLYESTGTYWQTRTIQISNPEPIDGFLSFQATTASDGTDAVRRTARVYLDNIEILSSGTPPIISGITQSPATSSGDKEPAPATITFTAQLSQGSDPITYRWDFNNDGTYDATGRTATYTYAQPGTYTCQLVVNNGEGATTASTTVYVDNPLPQGDFYASPISGNAPLDVQFILTAAAAGETYQWWFGDGNGLDEAADSTAAQPSHRYTTEGVYDVTCIITNSVGSVTLTKNQLITVNPEGSTTTNTGIGSIYAPHSVQMMFVDVFSNPISGLPVSFQVSTASGNLDEILKWFGISNPQAITGNQQATTSADGTISWLALPQIQYEVSYIWEGQTYKFLLYPQDNNYVIRVGSQQPGQLGEAAAQFTSTVSQDYSEISLGLQYYYAQTSNVYFWVKNDAGELIYSQTFSGNRVNTSVTVPNTKGTQYTWGYNASLTDGTVKTDAQKVEATGNPNVPLWDLGIQNYGYGLEWYMYIAFGITLLVASLFSFTTAKQGGVVVGLFLGSLFLFVGWIPAMYAPVISLAAGLAMIAAANKDGREIGFSSIILLIALSGAVIGLINGSQLFGGGFSGATIDFDYNLDQFADVMDSSIWTTAYTVLSVVQTMASMIFSAVHMLVFAAPMLISLGMPLSLASIITVAIWVVTLFWFFLELYPRLKT